MGEGADDVIFTDRAGTAAGGEPWGADVCQLLIQRQNFRIGNGINLHALFVELVATR